MQKPHTARRGFLALGSGLLASTALAAPQPKQDVRPGVTIAYEDEFFGPPWMVPETIVMLHGVAESHVAWQQWVPILGTRYRVIRPDLPGFGQSPFPASYDCTPKAIAADVIRFLDGLKVDKFHLVGAKYGGSIALELAADFPARVTTLAVFGTPAKGSPGGKADLTAFPERIRKEGVRGWAAATQRSRLGADATPEMMRWWTDELMGKADPAACIGYSGAAGVMDLEPILDRIAAPALVVTTAASPLQPVASARAYQQKIPDSELLVLPGDSYHIAAVRPRECATRLLAFIADS